MKERWTMPLPDGVQKLMERLEDGGYEAYVVGGCVRDALLGLTPKDYDLCTSASPEEMKQVFDGMRVIETGIAHGTLTVLWQGVPYEVTTYRIDGAYADHRHPDGVTFVRDLDQDLMRRDFTINAMAYNPRMGLQDRFSGREDLDARRIRCVGEAWSRFHEDALRILRALRFAAVYGFSIEEETACAARALCGSLNRVARERVTAEMCKLIVGPSAEAILTEFGEVIQVALPCALAPDGLSAVPPEIPLRLAHVLRHQEDVRTALGEMKLDHATCRAVCELVAAQHWTCPRNDAQARRLLKELGCERAMQLSRLKGWGPGALEAVLERGDCWSLKQLAVSGKDLMRAGIPAGRPVGELLNQLLDGVIEGRLCNERSELLEEAIKSVV